MPTPKPHDHWTRVYEEKSPSEVSWYQPEPAPSLRALDRFVTTSPSALIDIGGGASNLVDALLQRGWSDLTVLDIAVPALRASRERLGALADKVNWIAADITQWRPERRYGVWHDRAAFHFLTEPEQRGAYRKALLEGTEPGGFVIVATFALDGPEKCSGLQVRRYDATGLSHELGTEFELIESWSEEHATPWGSGQSFNWCVFRKRS